MRWERDLEKNRVDWGFKKSFYILWPYGDPSVGHGWYGILWVLSAAIYEDMSWWYKFKFHTLKIQRAFEAWNHLVYKAFPTHYDPSKDKQRKIPQYKQIAWRLLLWRSKMPHVSVKEKYGTLRIDMMGGHGGKNYDRIYDLVDQAERFSEYTCEDCGKRGRTIEAPWVYTACREHTSPEDTNGIEKAIDLMDD